MTDVVEHWPERCGCGHVFGEEEREPAGAPARHQVAELPPLAVEISEHRLQRLCCPDCGRTVRAELQAGVPRGCFGPKLEAAIASLTVRNRLSRRQLVELLDELFGCPVAVGTIDAILTRTGKVLEPVYEELLDIYRKLSLGSRSQGGERTIERLLSVDQTCRLQRRSLYAYLADVLTAKARGDPIPTIA